MARHRLAPAPHFTVSVCSPGHILTNEAKSSMLNGTSQLCHWHCNSLLLIPKGTSATPRRGTDGVKSIHSVGVTNNGGPLRLALVWWNISAAHASDDGGAHVWAAWGRVKAYTWRSNRNCAVPGIKSREMCSRTPTSRLRCSQPQSSQFQDFM